MRRATIRRPLQPLSCLGLALAAACFAAAFAVTPALAAPPSVGAPSATNLQGTSALLQAEVNPGGMATTVRFEYLTQAAFEAGGFAKASLTPLSPIGAGTSTKTATAALSGLSPNTTYRFRAKASNSSATATGAEATAATTSGFGFLAGSAGFTASLSEADGSSANKAGTHPHALSMSIAFKLGGEFDGQPGTPFTDGDLRKLRITMPPGLLLNPTAVEVCPQADFHTPRDSPFQQSLSGESCPDRSQVGTVAIDSSYGPTRTFGVFNVEPRHGAPATLGFAPFGTPIELVPRIRESDAALVFEVENFPQRLDLLGLDLVLWGTPWATPANNDLWTFPHDDERGNCLNEVDPDSPFGKPAEYEEVESSPPAKDVVYVEGTCSAGNPRAFPPLSFLTLPVACAGPIQWSVEASSWQQPGTATSAAKSPSGILACNKTLATARAQLTTESAASATGLEFTLDVNDGGGLMNPAGILRPPIRRAVAQLPEGLTINPSVGAGLGVCSSAQFARESVDTVPGQGCPNPSKIGDVSVDGLLGLEETVKGSLYLAQPYDNPFSTLLALYITVSSPERGLFVKSIGKVEPDPSTGRLKATFDDLPQLAYTAFHLRFREGQRAVMISPPSCGRYNTRLTLSPWPQPAADVDGSSSFAINSGEGGGGCPTSALRPFHPALVAGSLNPSAAAYTPFNLHITRTDAEQELTSYSATFPPGLLGNLTGVASCPDAAIEAAKHRSALEEETNPACPANSKIGKTLAGYGVGQVLAYAPGSLYLAGAYHGSPLSVAAITSARVGPFDLGTVVVRSAIRIDPRTGQASIDATGSDPIPHILSGIPLHLRDIRVYVDRPHFTLNPTNCDPLSSVSRLTGSGADVFTAADDSTAFATDRFQVLGCSSLGFKPKLALRLKGGTKRGDFPALRATVTPRAGDANFSRATVALPPSLFLAQEHLETICTRPQFAAGRCPAKSIYGRARATTPLLDEPMEGPVYLRASDDLLPELVAALDGGGVRIEVVGGIDTDKGGLRGTFELLPDAPATKFTMSLFGGRRGLLVNADDVCRLPMKATAKFVAQNNKGLIARPKLVNPKCNKKTKQGKREHRR